MNVTVRDASGNVEEIHFNQKWARKDDQPVVSTKKYPIGDDVDLIRVRATAAKCSCIGQTHD